MASDDRALLARGSRLAGCKAFTTRAAQEANQLTEPGCAFLLASAVVMTGSVKLLRPKAGDTVRATDTRPGSTAVRFA